jgi:hypothetical protein
MERIQRIHADATLEAGPRQLPEAALHLVLHDKIGGARRNMEETIDALAGQRRHRGSEFRIAVREVVSLRNRVDRGPDDRMVDRLGDQFAHQVDLQISAPQALNVIGPRPDRISRKRGVTACSNFLIHLECLRCRARSESGRNSQCYIARARRGLRRQLFLTNGQTLSLSGRNAWSPGITSRSL